MNTESDNGLSSFEAKELEFRDRETRIAEKAQRLWWRNALIVPIILILFAGLLELFWEKLPFFQQAEYASEAEQFHREHAKMLDVLDLPSEEDRLEKLCTYHYSNFFKNADIVEELKNTIADDPKCTEAGYIRSEKPDAGDQKEVVIKEDQLLSECISGARKEPDSCRAYDKSGLHSRPRDSCALKLEAGIGFFFAQEKVTVVSEYYRKLSGKKAMDAMNARKLDGKIIGFEGRIKCSNSAGTARTCEAKATISAVKFPDKCFAIKDKLLGSQSLWPK